MTLTPFLEILDPPQLHRLPIGYAHTMAVAVIPLNREFSL